MKEKILVIAGASGSGKTTIVKSLVEKYPNYFEISVSYTTRAPRAQEVNGRDYHFITRDEFEKKIERKDFAEYAEYAGNYYGTELDVDRVKENKKIRILEIEKKGVESVKKMEIPAKYLYIYSPINALHKRILQRAFISEDELSKRLMKAAEENAFGKSGAFDKVVENIDLEEAFEEVIRFVTEVFPEIED